MIDRTKAPQVHMMGDLSLPHPEQIILDNGITLHYVQGGTQEVNQLCIIWSGGSIEAPDPAAGRLMASVMCEGTSSRSGAAISEAVDFHGAILKGGALPHHTSLQLTSINSMTPGILPVVADIITDATYPDDVYARYRDNEVQDFMLSRSNVMVLARDAATALIAGADHPEALPESAESIAAVSVDTVRDYYRRVIRADGCHAFLSGRLSQGVIDNVIALLGRLPVREATVPANIVPYCAQQPQTVEIIREGAVQAAVVADLPAPDRSDPDYVPLRFTVMALGGYFGSRLMKNVREDKGYTYGIGSYLMGSPEGCYVRTVAQTDARYVAALIDEVRSEIRRLATEPLAHDEMTALKQYISSSLMENLDSPFAIMDYYRTIHTVGLPDGYFERQVKMVHELTPEAIMQMAARYLDADALRIAIAK